METLGIWNYVILAALVFVEGPTATLLGAAAAGSGALNPLAVFAVAALSNLSADSFWYSLGRLGHKADVLRLAQKVGVKEAVVERMKAKMREHALKILLAAKLTLSFSIPALLAAGIVRISWRKVLLVLAAAETLWTGSLVFAGMYLGRWLVQLERGARIASVAGGVIFLLFLVTLVKRHGKDWINEQGEGDFDVGEE